MGTYGDDDDDKIKPPNKDLTPNFSDTDTQSLDTRSFSGEEFRDEDATEFQFVQSTIPFDDTVPLEDTQLMDLGGETQVMDDLDCVENMETQLFDDFDTEVVADTDSEGTERTEILSDTEEFSDDDSRKTVGTCPVDQKDMLSADQLNNGPGVNKADSTGLSNGKCSSGSVPRDFTSVRSASIRASGLTARKMALREVNSGLCSIMSDGLSLSPHDPEHNGTSVMRDSANFVDKVDQEHTLGKHMEQMKGSSNLDECGFGRSTARKLFTEDTEDLGNNANACDGGAESTQLFASEDEFAGLSYLDSQEPGELSQMNALDAVDKFLKTTVVEFDQEVDIRKSTGGKSNPVSSAKGTRSLVKSANLISTAGEKSTFDWDDSREDEGGGEFFSKKKEAFFGNGDQRRRSFTQPREPRAAKESRDKVMGLVYSDSALLHKKKGNVESTELTDAKFRKNLIKELNEQSDIGSKEEMVEKSPEKDMPDIGFDTQMAAEAMEALCFEAGGTDHDCYDGKQVSKNKKNDFLRGTKNGAHAFSLGVTTRQFKPVTRSCTKLRKDSSFSSLKHSRKVRNHRDKGLVKAELKKAKSDAKEHLTTNESRNLSKVPFTTIQQRRKGKALKRSDGDSIRFNVTASSGQRSLEGRQDQDQVGTFTPIACRTRGFVEANQSKRRGDASSGFREGTNDLTSSGALRRKRRRTTADAFAKDKFTEMDSNQNEESDPKLSGTTSAVKFDTLDYPRRPRTRQQLSSIGQEANGQSIGRLKRSINEASTPIDLGIKRKTLSSVNREPVDIEEKSVAKHDVEAEASKHLIGRSDAEGSPRERLKPSASACITPVNCVTPINEASPICMGDEYLKQSCRKNLSKSSLMKEINRLTATGQEPSSAIKGSRKRRDMASVKVLFSHHLDRDIINQQKKILGRLGATVASSMSDATHFIADEFVRTRNMLEAIAFGKPVVTHLWVDSCGQASCLIDEKNYILRDAKKEKEFGFILPVSLASASQRPLLQGQRVLITPNTKPGKEILGSLVKAVHGVAVERVGRSVLKDDKIPDDLLVLSCEEDYKACLPFLEKGAAVYSSELLLDGIVTQKLAYERHRLFADHVKRTRSTIWLKDSNQFHPVTRGI